MFYEREGCYNQTFEYSLLGAALKKKTEITEKQCQELNKVYKYDKKNVNKPLDLTNR